MRSGDGVRRWRRKSQEMRAGDGVGYMKIPPIKKAIAVVKYAIAN
jgi:hypothetical protein